MVNKSQVDGHGEKEGLVVMISNHVLGGESVDLGKILMKSFLASLAQLEIPPKAIMFLNSGVYLTTEGSNTLETLNSLAEKGTSIYSCGTCLDFFQLKDKLKIGLVSDMATVTKEMIDARSVIKF